MRGRRALLAGTTIAALACCAGSAQADHHEVRIAEVFAGSASSPAVEYVQLEMTSSGQNQFTGSGSTVTLLGPTGVVNRTVNIGTNVANGQRGRRVLAGSETLETHFGNSPLAVPDFLFNDDGFLTPAGGAACFTSGVFGPRDCVSWGNFSGSTASPTGGNTAAITDTMALGRRVPACGPGLIDTNSPSNWLEVEPNPLNNTVLAATGDPCPNTTITRKPKAEATKRKAKFKFTATQGVDEFKCKLDNGPFKDCDSPFKKRVGIGKHKFKVRAEGDPSPARYSWKVIEE